MSEDCKTDPPFKDALHTVEKAFLVAALVIVAMLRPAAVQQASQAVKDVAPIVSALSK